MSISRGSDRTPTGPRKGHFAELAAALRVRRDELGLSRKDLASATGLSYPYIAQLEGGYRAPSLGSARKLAAALSLPVEDLVALADDDPVLAGSPPPPAAYANPIYAPSIAMSAMSADDGPAGEMLATDRRLSRVMIRSDAARAVLEAREALSRLPAEDRLIALSQLQAEVLDDVVTDRVERARRRLP